MEKILTIVIPTYNMQDYLRRCLDSLIVPEEQMKQLEVLVVNDGSKDDSSAIAHEYQDKYPDTFRVIDKENGNYGSCVNRGLKEATGKYIKVLDADDWFDAEGFEQFIKKLQTLDVDVVFSDFNVVNVVDGTIKKWKIICPKNKIIGLEDVLNVHPLGVMMHSVCYRTAMVRSISYKQPEGISYTDQIWINEPMANAKTIYYYPIMVYQYMVGREGQTVDPNVSARNIKHHIGCAIEMIKAISRVPANTIQQEFLKRRAEHTINGIYLMFLANNKLDMSILSDFDDEIKNLSPCVYDDLDKVVLHPFLRFHYVKKWRKNHTPFTQTELILLKASSILYKFFYRKSR